MPALNSSWGQLYAFVAGCIIAVSTLDYCYIFVASVRDVVIVRHFCNGPPGAIIRSVCNGDEPGAKRYKERVVSRRAESPHGPYLMV